MYIREIKKIYPLVYEAILSQTYSNLTIEQIESRTVNDVFTWSSTQEGRNFWSAVFNGNWAQAQLLKPEYFVSTEENENFLVKTNGLFN